MREEEFKYLSSQRFLKVFYVFPNRKRWKSRDWRKRCQHQRNANNNEIQFLVIHDLEMCYAAIFFTSSNSFWRRNTVAACGLYRWASEQALWDFFGFFFFLLPSALWHENARFQLGKKIQSSAAGLINASGLRELFFLWKKLERSPWGADIIRTKFLTWAKIVAPSFLRWFPNHGLTGSNAANLWCSFENQSIDQNQNWLELLRTRARSRINNDQNLKLIWELELWPEILTLLKTRVFDQSQNWEKTKTYFRFRDLTRTRTEQKLWPELLTHLRTRALLTRTRTDQNLKLIWEPKLWPELSTHFKTRVSDQNQDWAELKTYCRTRDLTRTRTDQNFQLSW